MLSDVDMKLKRNHLYVRLTGKPGLESMKHQAESMLDTCLKNRCHKVLINATKSMGLLSILDLYQLGVHFDKMWNRNIRIAVVVPSDKLPEHKFFETVARNRGVLIATFVHIRDANKWLNSDVCMN